MIAVDRTSSRTTSQVTSQDHDSHHDDAHAAEHAAPVNAPLANAPSPTLRAMAQLPPVHPSIPSATAPKLATQVAGTQPRVGIDRPMALMANAAYDDPAAEERVRATQVTPYAQQLSDAGWQRVDPASLGIKSSLLEDPDRSGFRASIFRNTSGQTVVAFAGTDPSQPGDLKTDGGQGLGVPTTQYQRAVTLAHQVQDKVGRGNVAFTGHSLGGGLAATAALATGETAVTFNAAGVSNETMRSLGYVNPNDVRAAYAQNGLIRSYAVAGDPLTTVDERGGAPQIGASWTLPITQQGLSSQDGSAAGLLALHGGSGANQQYVDGFNGGAAAIKPGIVQNGAVEGYVQMLGAGGSVLAQGGALLGPLGLPLEAVGGLATTFALLPPAERNAALNITLGNAATAARGYRNDLIAIDKQAAKDLAGIDVRRDPFALTRIEGAVGNAVFDAAGASAKEQLLFAGRTVTGLTDAAGTEIRNFGREHGLNPTLANGAARVVEFGGDAARARLDFAARAVNAVADKAGDAVRGTANGVADGERAVVDAAAWTGRKVEQGVIATAGAVQSAATWGAQKVADARAAVTQTVEKNWDYAKEQGLKLFKPMFSW